MEAEMPDDLDLVAFRYVAGEMTEDEATQFEVRLADDHPAREAVSRAVALAERLAEAGPLEPSVAPVETRRAAFGWAIAPLGWMTAGAAAALLTVSLLGQQGERTVPSPPGTSGEGAMGPGEPRAHPNVDALVWARLQASPQWAAADLERWLEEPGGLSGELSGEDEADWSDEMQVPAWVHMTTKNSNRGNP